MFNRFTQRKQEKITYSQRVTGDTIASAVWSVAPAATLTGQVNLPGSTAITLSGLAANRIYDLTCTLTLASGQIYHRTATITCPVE